MCYPSLTDHVGHLIPLALEQNGSTELIFSSECQKLAFFEALEVKDEHVNTISIRAFCNFSLEGITFLVLGLTRLELHAATQEKLELILN